MMTHDEYLGHLGRQFCLTPYACSSVTKWVGITDGPYRRQCDLVVRRSGFLKGVHSTTT